MKISFMMLTLDRNDLTQQCFKDNMTHAGSKYWPDIEILIADNGSKDKRIVDWGKSIATYHRANSINAGVAHEFCQLYLRAKGDIIVLLGNDLVNAPGWLEKGIEYAYAIPNSGIIGYDWQHGSTPPVSVKNGIRAHWLTPVLNRVFGTWVIRRRVIEEIGFFHEDFKVYSLEDSNFNDRVNLAGFNSCYLPDIKSVHKGTGHHDSGEYREMKNKAMAHNADVYGRLAAEYQSKGIRYPLPPMKDPL